MDCETNNNKASVSWGPDLDLEFSLQQNSSSGSELEEQG